MDIVAYMAKGEPLNVAQYKAEIQKELDDIEAGRVASDNNLAESLEIGKWPLLFIKEIAHTTKNRFKGFL
ncbi:hypothetical protein [Galbibacter pacificus]|uniref:Uncharacterized protein n=1 Tax=Galbibacter pacificus TaxID=2996052 RepID=A0ABT6FRT5_9FLAO|nr:hypothetical protein [Galbibacter pacificus]MDG3582925.1 hypothetical protein [Galbibacter pacificus]MDG3585956.1 hypothetical protein [Galbibacter pacificus]